MLIVVMVVMSSMMSAVVNDIHAINNWPDPSNEEDASQELQNSDAYSIGSVVVALVGVNDSTESWDEDVKNKAKYGKTVITGIGVVSTH